MRLAILTTAAALALASAAGTAQAGGCLKGAVVGGVAGHFAGRHPILGAGAGCVIGHHMDKTQQRRDQAVAQGRGHYDSHHRFHKD